MFEISLNIQKAYSDWWVAQKTATLPSDPVLRRLALEKIRKGRSNAPALTKFADLYEALQLNKNERYYYEHAGLPTKKKTDEDDDEADEEDDDETEEVADEDAKFIQQWCIPFYDFDAATDKQLTSADIEEIICAILGALLEVHGDRAVCRYATACGYSPEKQKYKFSMHVYVHGVGKYECPLSFRDHKISQARDAVDKALNAAGYSYLGKVLDEGIYKKTNTSLRTIYSFKRGENERPLMPHDEEGNVIPLEDISIDEFSQFFFTRNIFCEEPIVEWGWVPADSREERVVEGGNNPVVKHALTVLDSVYPEIAAVVTLRKAIESGADLAREVLLIFDRSEAKNVWCPICARMHDGVTGDCFLFMISNNDQVVMFCRRDVKPNGKRTAWPLGESLPAVERAEELSLFSDIDPVETLAKNAKACYAHAAKPETRSMRADNTAVEEAKWQQFMQVEAEINAPVVVEEIKAVEVPPQLAQSLCATFDAEDELTYSKFRDMYKGKVFTTIPEAVKAIRADAARVLVYLDSASGCYIKKDGQTAKLRFSIIPKIAPGMNFTFYIKADDVSDKKAMKFTDLVEFTTYDILCKYRRPICHPMPDLEHKDSFKTWCGPKAKLLPEFDTAKVQPWIDLVRDTWANGNDDYCQWILRYMAIVVCSPHIMTDYCVAVIGKEGCGKNTFIDFLNDHVLGSHLCTVFDKMSELESTFNSILLNKRLAVIDEMKRRGNDLRQQQEIWDGLKSKITRKTFQCRQMYMDPRDEANLASWVLLSNNRDSMFMSMTDRRYVVFDCGEKYMKNHVFWDHVRATMFNDDIGSHFYTYLKSIEVPLLTLKETEPKTELKAQIIAECVAPEDRYLDELADYVYGVYSAAQAKIIQPSDVKIAAETDTDSIDSASDVSTIASYHSLDVTKHVVGLTLFNHYRNWCTASGFPTKEVLSRPAFYNKCDTVIARGPRSHNKTLYDLRQWKGKHAARIGKLSEPQTVVHSMVASLST